MKVHYTSILNTVTEDQTEVTEDQSPGSITNTHVTVLKESGFYNSGHTHIYITQLYIIRLY